MTHRQPRRRAPGFQSAARKADTGFRTLPIAEYEALYGPVGEYHHIEGGVVEFVLERPDQIRFLGVKKDGQPYHALRWPKQHGA